MEVNCMKCKVMCVLCSVLILISLVFISSEKYQEYKNYRESKQLQSLQEEQKREEERIIGISKKLEEQVEKVIQKQKEQKEKKAQKTILPQYEKLHNANKDFYGWIKIENTKIDYPVMYTPENPNFYVYKNFEGKESELGSIYINGYSNIESANNIIIYGHNRADLTMFGYLSCYKEKQFYDTHKYIEFNTIYEEGTYEIIAVCQAFIRKEDLMDPKEENKSKIPFKELEEDEYLFYNHANLESKEEFEEFIKYIKKSENTYFPINSTAEYGEKLITLCTCTNVKKYQNERLLIIAKKIE